MQSLGIVIAIGILGVAALAATSASRRQRALRRLYEHDSQQPLPALIDPASSDSWLARWLARGGYRAPTAASTFVTATVGCGLIGLVVGQAYRLGVQQTLISQLAGVPGSAGDALNEILKSGPWILFTLGTLLPMSLVRSARRARVRAIEQDLPLALEMLATMAEAGLSFDAALTNIVRERGSDRPLTAEFVKFQHDMVAGVPRAQALRQLARRVHLPSLSGVTSALVQAEQVGASVAETLQHQAADMRQRRREEALLQAQALPVKLVFPLVICFLPGVFLSTLAPVLYQMVQVANSVLRSGQ